MIVVSTHLQVHTPHQRLVGEACKGLIQHGRLLQDGNEGILTQVGLALGNGEGISSGISVQTVVHATCMP